MHLFTFDLVSQATLTTVVSVVVLCHENTWATLVLWAFLPGALDLAIIVYFVKLQNSQLDSLVLVLNFLWLGVGLLLSLLTATT